MRGGSGGAGIARARRGRGLAMAEEAAVRAQAETVRRLKQDKADADEVRGLRCSRNGVLGEQQHGWERRGMRTGAVLGWAGGA